MKKEIPVIEGSKYEINIRSLGSSAEGVGKIKGFTVFVPGALPGETVTVKIETIKKSYAMGSMQEIIQASADRVEPRCKLYEQCGGCQLQHLSYAAQLVLKRQQVIDALERIGGQKNLQVKPVIGVDNPWCYRNKMQFPVGKTRDGIAIGCFASKTHEIVDTKECYIQKSINNDIVNVMREAICKFRLSVYDEDRHTGLLRHVMGRVGKNGECMVVLVTSMPILKQARELVQYLRQKLPTLVSVQQNIQTYHNNVILGRETKLLWGKPVIKDNIGNLEFNISARSFFQVNTSQAEVLYGKALEYAKLTGNETVIDAYCGTGTITLFLAQKAGKVYGIEIVQPAIIDAKKNARDNYIKNAEFIVGDTAVIMPRLYKQGVRPDVIVVDPPRAGCELRVLQAVASMQPKRIVYVSCNPATLARDIAILSGKGYYAEKVQPVDMFPMTGHVECVCLMSRVEK